MKKNDSNSELQFSVRGLLILVTVACVVLAFPGGYVLVVIAAVWMLVGAAIAWVLMKFRRPLYRLLSGVRVDERDQ